MPQSLKAVRKKRLCFCLEVTPGNVQSYSQLSGQELLLWCSQEP